MLEANSITVQVGATRLLNCVSVAVEPGRMLAVVGQNGAGKSTLLHALSGDFPPQGGEVRMDGRPLNRWKIRERARVRAVLSQYTALDFPFTVRDVVLMGRSPHSSGTPGSADENIARAALDLVEGSHLAKRLYPSLSGGERQRVQFARVLAQIWEPHEAGASRYLLLDEPTASLDLVHQHSLLRVARSFAGCGVGVLTVLHDLTLAGQYADSILVLKAGAVFAMGAPAAVLTPPIIESAFGVPACVIPHPHLGHPVVLPNQ